MLDAGDENEFEDKLQDIEEMDRSRSGSDGHGRIVKFEGDKNSDDSEQEEFEDSGDMRKRR